jgi:hypothetical protein
MTITVKPDLLGLAILAWQRMNHASAKTGVRGGAMTRVTARPLDARLGGQGVNQNLKQRI